MNGHSTTIPLKNGRDEARSRRKKSSTTTNSISSSGNGSIANSDSGGSRSSNSKARSDRMDMRKKRVHRSRARKYNKKDNQRSNAAAMCFLGCVIFVLYLLVCVLFVRHLPEGEAKGMRGLVKKTQDKMNKLKEKVGKHGNSFRRGSVAEVAPPSSKSNVPVGRWPISIRDEDGNFEDIQHPGIEDGSVTMSVPKFWAEDPVAIHEHKLMSRERALSIGTCITPDPFTGSNARGDKCPLNERTVFVAIASYRDWQCRDTVTSIFSAARHPERIRVAVVDQIVAGEDGSCDIPHSPCAEDPNQPICLHKNQIDVFQMDAELAVGPVFARHIGHRLYRGEYYTMQSDAHVTFTTGWDMDIINQMEDTGDEMAVLSTYLTDIVGSIDPDTGMSKRKTRPIMCNTEYEGGAQGKHLRHLSQPEGLPDIHGMPQLQVSR